MFNLYVQPVEVMFDTLNGEPNKANKLSYFIFLFQ